MSEALRKQIDALGGAVEEMKSFGKRVEDIEAKMGTVPSDYTEQERRIDDAISRITNIKSSLDTVAQERIAEAKKIGELESAGVEFQKQLEEMAQRNGRPTNSNDSPDVAAHKAAFNAHMRKGTIGDLGDLQLKAIQTTVDADGGFAVPESVDMTMIQLERLGNPMRSVSGQLTVSTPDYKKLVNLGGGSAGWVGETAARPVTDSPTMAQIPAFMGEVYSNPMSTQSALDDMTINVEAWLAGEVSIDFAEQENGAFSTGNGTNKPKGILAYPTAATTDKAASRAFGTLEEMDMTGTSTFTGDNLIDAIHSLRAGYRSNAQWMMTNLTLSAARKLKDADNNYLWRAGLEVGISDSLLGYGLVENEELPELTAGAGSASILFGNFARGYLVVDRMGTRILRDPYTNKPNVHFYTTKRVGGMLVDSLAIKVLATVA